eukprot:jgi/Mesvir1/20070/Mv13321-RA.1
MNTASKRTSERAEGSAAEPAAKKASVTADGKTPVEGPKPVTDAKAEVKADPKVAGMVTDDRKKRGTDDKAALDAKVAKDGEELPGKAAEEEAGKEGGDAKVEGKEGKEGGEAVEGEGGKDKEVGEPTDDKEDAKLANGEVPAGAPPGEVGKEEPKKKPASSKPPTMRAPLQCRFCKRNFSGKQALGGHMKSHRREREQKEHPHTGFSRLEIRPEPQGLAGGAGPPWDYRAMPMVHAGVQLPPGMVHAPVQGAMYGSGPGAPAGSYGIQRHPHAAVAGGLHPTLHQGGYYYQVDERGGAGAGPYQFHPHAANSAGHFLDMMRQAAMHYGTSYPPLLPSGAAQPGPAPAGSKPAAGAAGTAAGVAGTGDQTAPEAVAGTLTGSAPPAPPVGPHPVDAGMLIQQPYFQPGLPGMGPRPHPMALLAPGQPQPPPGMANMQQLYNAGLMRFPMAPDGTKPPLDAMQPPLPMHLQMAGMDGKPPGQVVLPPGQAPPPPGSQPGLPAGAAVGALPGPDGLGVAGGGPQQQQQLRLMMQLLQQEQARQQKELLLQHQQQQALLLPPQMQAAALAQAQAQAVRMIPPPMAGGKPGTPPTSVEGGAAAPAGASVPVGGRTSPTPADVPQEQAQSAVAAAGASS